MALNVGIVLGFFSGLLFYNMDDNVEWRVMFLCGAILPAIMIVLVRTIMPESPRWLVDKGQDEEAKLILQQIYPPGM
jgi:MFS family permease